MAKITKVMAGQFLTDVPQDKQFWCTDGQAFKNLSELAAGLKQMSEETFRYHVNKTKNDFSKWVSDVIGDVQLSLDLQKVTSRTQAAKVVSDKITMLKRQK